MFAGSRPRILSASNSSASVGGMMGIMALKNAFVMLDDLPVMEPAVGS
jgi:hypothetical protein